MAPSPITEDYYMILEVEQTASPQLILRAYRRLALKLHPDRNPKLDTTEAFKLLGQAYETLKDETKRRDYDLIYPSLAQKRHSPQNTQTPHPPSTSTPQSEALSEAAQIAAIQKLKQERNARWCTKKTAFDSLIFELQRGIRQLDLEIKDLNSILAAKAAIEAQRNSWGTWLLSPIYGKERESEEEKERKDRESQERRIERDMKERRLELKKADLKTQEDLLRKAKNEVDAADLCDDRKLQAIRLKKWTRENGERQEKERMEKEKMERQWKEQWEKLQREVAEAVRKKQAEKQAEQNRHKEEETKHRWEQHRSENTHQAYASACRHDGWWPKVQGRTKCPECSESWTYLLQCPGCKMKACPRCQAAIRPRMPRNAARASQRARPRVRTPSPDFGYHDYW